MTVRARQLARRCRERLAAQQELTSVSLQAKQQASVNATATKPETGQTVR